MNIYVAPKEDSTFVSVNCKFVLTVATDGSWTQVNGLGTVLGGGELPAKSSTNAFSTGQPETANWGSAEVPSYVTCQSVGRLEAEILSMALDGQDPRSAAIGVPGAVVGQLPPLQDEKWVSLARPRAAASPYRLVVIAAGALIAGVIALQWSSL